MAGGEFTIPMRGNEIQIGTHSGDRFTVDVYDPHEG